MPRPENLPKGGSESGDDLFHHQGNDEKRVDVQLYRRQKTILLCRSAGKTENSFQRSRTCAQKKREFSERGEIEMPSHIRLYTIERSNILPKEETIADDRVSFYITDDELALEERNRKRNIICNELPLPIFELLKNRFIQFRFSSEYRLMSRSVKSSARRGFVQKFISDLFDQNSEMREMLKGGIISVDDYNYLEKIFKRYGDVKPEDLYLTYSIKIN